MAKVKQALPADFRKCASVTPGGKPYFWTRRDPESDRRQWLVWNRAFGRWTLEQETEGFSQILRMADTPEGAFYGEVTP